MEQLLRVAPSVLLAFLAAAPAAHAGRVLSAGVEAKQSSARSCAASLRPASDSVARASAVADATGLLRATSRGTGDWDLGVFDARTGRPVAASASPDGSELAVGYVFRGQELAVQACRFDDGAGRGHVAVDVVGLRTRATEGFKQQVVAVHTPSRADKDRLGLLGLDPAEGAGPRTVDVVLHDAEDARKLREAGFTWTVRLPDLGALARSNARADRAFAARTARSALPSGRTEYRRLADYETELKTLAQANPGLVKLIALPHRSLEGREILGVEIAKDVNVPDGKPVFLQLGVHHAREWPAGEHPMEWAYELVRGYGTDARVTRIVDGSRTIVVPVVNPDGFTLTREAPVDLGNALAAIDLPPEIDNPETLPVTDPTYTAAILLDIQAGTFAYKRRNCRVKDGEIPAPGECGNRENRTFGVDPNRNYGGLWGGPGASLDPTNDTYRGPAPFSEPETQNVRELVLANQVTVLITNHTFTGLILRPPGVRAQGPPPDEPKLKALGDAMAAQNGYASQLGYQLYDTTGTTEDWSYAATRGFGYTFEIGKDEFHPPYEEQVAEYSGPTEFGGQGGNRGAYFLAAEFAMDTANHGVLAGTAPKGTTLRLHKEFLTSTSPVIQDAEGNVGPAQQFPDVLDTTMRVGDDGRFAWHVNPSTRPGLARERTTSDVAREAASTQDISSATAPLPGVSTLHEFEVKPDAARQIRASTTGTVPIDDIDLYLYKDEVSSANLVGSSAGGSADELVLVDNPEPGKYILEIRNFLALGPYDGQIQVFGSQEGSVKLLPAVREAYTLTCETAGGRVFATRKVEVDADRRVDLGDACRGVTAASKRLIVSAALDRRALGRALTRGVRARVRCSRTCTVRPTLRVSGATAKRLGLSRSSRRPVTVATARARKISRRATFTLRFTKAARSKLRRSRSVRVELVAIARDTAGRRASRRVRTTLRR